jgi:hypothetical protein
MSFLILLLRALLNDVCPPPISSKNHDRNNSDLASPPTRPLINAGRERKSGFNSPSKDENDPISAGSFTLGRRSELVN